MIHGRMNYKGTKPYKLAFLSVDLLTEFAAFCLTYFLHCPKTSERNFNLGVLNLYEIHFMALLSVKYPYPVSNVLLHRI
jgi:hypothetical protein